MSTFKATTSSGKAELEGYLDENSDLTSLKSLAGAVVINFKQISRVNSCGIREWINLITQVPKAELAYEECPIVVVKQLNAVPDFQGKAKVKSFYAPYFCEDCDKESVKLLESAAIGDGKAPEMKCDDCGKPMNFDGIPNQYFSFLKRAA